MGLFDFMNTGDPEKDSMIREGLLQFGLGLMSSRGRTLPAIGNAGRQSLSAMDAYKQRQFQGKLNDYQLKQLQQAEALSKLPGKYITPGSPEVQGNNPSAYTPAVPESMDLRGLANAYMAAPGGLPTGLQLQSMLKKDDKPLVVAEGAAVVGPDGVPRFFNPKTEKPEKMTSDRENYEEAKKGGFKGSFLDYQLALRRAGATSVSYGTPVSGVDEKGNPVFFQPAKGGGQPSIIPGVKPNPKENVSQDERQAAGALARLESSMALLERMAGKNPKALEPGLPQEAVRSVTEIGANMMTDADRQKVESAQLDALDAALWLATGAAYNKEQLQALRKAYFPQVGDKPTVKEEKRQKLQVVIDSARTRAGRATLPQNGPQQPNNSDPLGLR